MKSVGFVAAEHLVDRLFVSHSLGSRKDDVCFWWERLTLFAEGGKADTEFCNNPTRQNPPIFLKIKTPLLPSGFVG